MKNFRINYTSDTHGYLYPTDYTGRAEKAMGLFKLSAAFERGENTLIIDGGDTLQGSPFTNYEHRLGLRPHPIAQAMNAMGYQYVALGNHDFNFGLGELSAYLTDLNAVCLCANIRDKAGRLPIRPYAVHTLENGLRIGLVGVCTHYVTVWERRKTLDELIIEPPIPAARRALEAIRGDVDVTVCIYHGGFERDLQTGALLTDSEENQAWRLCEELGFDVVLTGHQHMAVPGVRIGGSLAVQPAYRAVHYIEVSGTVDHGRVRAESCIRQPAEEAPAALTQLLAPVEAQVEAWLDTPKGHLDQPLDVGDHLEMAANGCLLANFINQVQLDASGAQVSATSMGNDAKGIRRDATIRDVVSAYVYSNTLVLLEMTGAQLKRYLERCASYFTLEDGRLAVSPSFLKPKVEHYNYDFFSGMDYGFAVRKPLGERVTFMRLNGRDIAPDEPVRVCVNNYRATGTGGYEVLREAKVLREIQTDVSELIIAYFESHPAIHVDTHRYLTLEE